MPLKNSHDPSEQYPFLEFYRKFFDIPDEAIKEDGNVELYCPDYFHVKRKGHPQTDAPKYYVNVISGAGICHTCKVHHTDAEGFIMEKDGVNYEEAKKIVSGELDVDPVPDDLIDRMHKNLMGQEIVLGFLQRVKCLSLETIERFKMGFDGERIWTPIPNEQGEIVNVRKYLKGAKKNKVLSFAKGYGRTRIFPINNLLTRRSNQRLVLFGGEHKVMAADQTSRSLPADKQWASITTAGEGTLPPYLLNTLVAEVKKGDPVLYVCMDIDTAGQIAAQRYANKLAPYGIECRMVRLPITEPANGDFNDYLAQGGSAEGFLKLLDEAEVLHVKHDEEGDNPENITPIRAHLSETSQGHLAGKYVESEVIVAGKDLSPFILPKTVDFKCNMEWGDKCEGCGLAVHNGEREMHLLPTDKGILNLINVSEKEINAELRKRARIVAKCPHMRLNVKEQMNVEEVLLIPELDFTAEDREYTTRRGYYVGHGMRANRAYSIKALSTPDPRTQHATLLVYNAEDGKTSLNNFQMTPELKEQLKVFQGPPKEVFHKIAEDLSYNVTRIYGREDVSIATDLVFHSALQFNFMGKLVNKGYLEALLFGDTRTGKSETVQNMHRHYRLGEFMDCGNTSFAGMVGGMQQTGNKRWQVTWGKIPLNNGGLVTLDEASSLRLEDIGNMTGIRSSGVAEIVKIQTERTPAMVRMIWISNPRQLNMTLAKYNFGLNGVQELIGRPEDIARFDFVVAVPFNEDLDKIINTAMHKEVPHVYTSDLCHSLILWAWTRKPEHIHFTDDAIQACLDGASKMGQDFTSQFPVVISADQRIKLARLAVATAVRCFSTPDGESVQVTKEHVDFAIDFLYRVYEEPALGYRDYSKQLNFTKMKAEKAMPTILKWMRTHKAVCETLLDFPAQFKALDLMDMLALDKDEARAILSFLREKGLIGPAGGAAYKKEAHFIDLLRNPRKHCEEHGVSWDDVDEGPELAKKF